MPDFERKICRPDELLARAAALPPPLVVTNGVFDLLHRGHVSYLDQARALGKALIVAVNDDASVRALGKGPGRPINCCDDRMALLAALASTSLVTSFSGPDARDIVTALHPAWYVKGGDYQVHCTPEGRAALAAGGRAIAIPFLHYTSSSALIRAISELTRGPDER